MTDRFEVAVIGAGAAGLAAAKELTAQGIRFVLLEASHRIGGRAHTEYQPDGAPFDLGCHWMHSASINPFVAIADQLGFRYDIREGYGLQLVNQHGAWLDHSAKARLSRASDEWTPALRRSFDQGLDHSLYEATDQEGEGPTKAVEIRGRDGSVARQPSLPPLRGPTRGVGGALAALRVRADPRRQRLT